MSQEPWSFEEKAQELKKVLAARNGGEKLKTWSVPFFGDVHGGSDRVTNSRNEGVSPAVAVLPMIWVLYDTTEAKGQSAGVDRVKASCFILPDRLLDRMDLVPENSWIFLLLLPPI